MWRGFSGIPVPPHGGNPRAERKAGQPERIDSPRRAPRLLRLVLKVSTTALMKALHQKKAFTCLATRGKVDQRLAALDPATGAGERTNSG
jgi:hypothetical protein